MDQTGPEQIDEDLMSETPEDVAVLYSWANMQGAKYRDFSPSRREYRAQMRFRAAEAQRESERRAQFEAETLAAAAEKAAREAAAAARFHGSTARQGMEGSGTDEAVASAIQAAAELAGRAETERLEAVRRAEAVTAAEAAARREEREMAEAHASAQRQALRYAESEMRRRAAAGPQPTAVGGQISDPYTIDISPARLDRVYHQPVVVPEDDMQPARYRQSSRERAVVPQSEASLEYLGVGSIEREAEIGALDVPVWPYESRPGERTLPGSESKTSFESQVQAESLAEREARDAYAARVTASPLASRLGSGALRLPQEYRPKESSELHPAYESRDERRQEPRIESHQELPTTARIEPWVEPAGAEQIAPAWIYSQSPEPTSRRTPPPAEDALQHSRKRTAPRWFGLKNVFDHSREEQQETSPEMRVPLLTVFSLAGGVGKTSVVATLGRALSSTGERVLLTDTTAYGLLPFYFGAKEQRLGAVRTFLPPTGSADAPISLVSYDLQQGTGDAAAQEWLHEELSRNSHSMQRVLVDLAASAAWVAGLLARMNSIMLVTVMPDMNSVISLQGVDKFFAGMVDGGGQAVQSFYLLNQFDESRPLHVDVREAMRQKLGERLLTFAIRRWEGMPEALAEGMTAMDYAPESAVAADYMNLAAWLRTQSAPAPAGIRTARWSER
jgi:cellulose synthase operon protein YhjQ